MVLALQVTLIIFDGIQGKITKCTLEWFVVSFLALVTAGVLVILEMVERLKWNLTQITEMLRTFERTSLLANGRRVRGSVNAARSGFGNGL